MGTMAARLALTALVGLLAACGSFPRGAPLEREVLAGQTDDVTRDIAIYPVTRAFLPLLGHWPAPLATAEDRDGQPWIGRGRASIAQMIEVGDRIDLVVYTTEENSLLTGPGQRSAQVSGAVVSPGGTIFVPYIGRVRVAGQSLEAARSLIQRQLEANIVDAQVQLTREVGRLAAVEVVAGVASPGRYPLPDGAMTALEVLAEAGGAQTALENPRLRLVRGHGTHTISLAKLYASPGLDTIMRAGDKLIVEEDPRTFVALGATGSERIVRFPQDEISALEALALAGGIDDTRADPQGILILREYGPGAVTPILAEGPDRERVVFAIDLTTSDGTFSANRFRVRSGDVVFATESPLTRVDAVTRLVGQVFGTVTRIGSL